jgi:hypothetical protein
MSRLNLEDSIIRNPRMLSASYGIIRFNLTGTFVIPPDGPTMHFLDPGGADRTVFLPAITPQAGQELYVANMSATKNLLVVDSNGIPVATVLADSTAVFISFIAGWRFLMTAAGAVTPPIVTEINAWTTQDVTAATATIAATDSEVYVNRAGAVTLTLPDAELWFAAHSFKTSSLLIKGINGAEGVNNILINRAGADVIDSLTSYTITSNFGGVHLRRVAAAKWGIV